MKGEKKRVADRSTVVYQQARQRWYDHDVGGSNVSSNVYVRSAHTSASARGLSMVTSGFSIWDSTAAAHLYLCNWSVSTR